MPRLKNSFCFIKWIKIVALVKSYVKASNINSILKDFLNRYQYFFIKLIYAVFTTIFWTTHCCNPDKFPNLNDLSESNYLTFWRNLFAFTVDFRHFFVQNMWSCLSNVSTFGCKIWLTKIQNNYQLEIW